MRRRLAAGIASGTFRPVRPELVAGNPKMAAHSWALRHRDLAQRMTLEADVEAEMELVLSAIRS